MKRKYERMTPGICYRTAINMDILAKNCGTSTILG